jgi:hypothetical protein
LPIVNPLKVWKYVISNIKYEAMKKLFSFLKFDRWEEISMEISFPQSKMVFS